MQNKENYIFISHTGQKQSHIYHKPQYKTQYPKITREKNVRRCLSFCAIFVKRHHDQGNS